MREIICRGPVDKLVMESGFTARLITQKMGIKYDKMVALRRRHSISQEEIDAVAKAIEKLKIECPEKIKFVKPKLRVVKEEKDLTKINSALNKEISKLRDEIKAYRKHIQQIEGLFPRKYYNVEFTYDNPYGHTITEQKPVLSIHPALAVQAMATEYQDMEFNFISVSNAAS